jgi:tRNA-splicing ligase RtcB
LKVSDIDDFAPIATEISRRISFGVGVKNDKQIDHEVIDHIRDAAFPGQRALLDLAASSLSSVGAGNHYVILVADEDDNIWAAAHFGSRGFGHKTANGFLSLAQGGNFDDHAPEGEMDSPPVLIPVDSDLGQAYIDAMNLAGEYAYAGRDLVVERVLDILGADEVRSVHNHHNFSWPEEHDGRKLWVVRKGATPAFPGQEGFVGGSMGDISAIVKGKDGAAANVALNSTVHGAGRVMSRTKAAGKWRKVWVCGQRGCDFPLNTPKAANAHPKKGACPRHQNITPRKVRVRQGGQIDWEAARADLQKRGIELRGGGADEAPGVYRPLDDVLAVHHDQIEVVHRFRPLVAVMAPADTRDPYKD